MNGILCILDELVVKLVWLYTILLFVYAVVSWIPDLRGRWVNYLAMVIEPVLQPIRRIVPPIGGLDIAFIVLLLVLQILIRPTLQSMASSVCFPY